MIKLFFPAINFILEHKSLIFDLSILIIILYCTFSSYFRGGIKEILSFVVLAGAAFMAFKFFGNFDYLLKKYLPNYEFLASLLTIIILFVLSFIMLSLVRYMIHQIVFPLHWHPLNKSLGLLVGCAKTFFFLGFLHICILWFFNNQSFPLWIKEMRFYPLFHYCGTTIRTLLPDHTLISDEIFKQFQTKPFVDSNNASSR